MPTTSRTVVPTRIQQRLDRPCFAGSPEGPVLEARRGLCWKPGGAWVGSVSPCWTTLPFQREHNRDWTTLPFQREHNREALEILYIQSLPAMHKATILQPDT